MNKLCIGTGWCSNSITDKKHPERSKLCLQSNWLSDYWRPQIEKYTKPDLYYCYISNCDIMPNDSFLNSKPVEINIGFEPVIKKLDPRHDFHCSLMMGAQYAFCNGMDFLFIEQDCMVKGLDKALFWARDKKLVYGFGEETSFQPGWAEQCFIYVNNIYLPEFISKLNFHRFHESMRIIPEINFHNVFKSDADFWSFGVGRRHELIDWNKEVFFIQQLTDFQIKEFREMR